MTDQSRWENDRYGDRSRPDYGRYRAGDPYDRTYEQYRYAEREAMPGQYQGGIYQGSDYRGEMAPDTRFAQSYRPGDSVLSEDRSFDRADYDPYRTRYAYGEMGYRPRPYGAGQPYGAREASGAMLHQGYQAPFGMGRQDRNEFRPYGDPASYAGGGYGGPSYGPGYGLESERGFWPQTRDEIASWFGDDEAMRRRRMDEARDAQHRGRGPKGYIRADERIREDVHERLTEDHRLDASDIEVKVEQGEVTLNGQVSKRIDKRRAEDLVDHLLGVKHVQNNLRVKEHASAPSSTYSASGATSTATAGKAAN